MCKWHTVRQCNSSVALMYMFFPLCTLSFQLVEPMVGGPNVLSRLCTIPAVKWSRSLRPYYHRGPICQIQLLIWGWWPPAARWRDAAGSLHIERRCLGLHLLWHQFAHTHPQFLHVYCSASSTNNQVMIWKWRRGMQGI